MADPLVSNSFPSQQTLQENIISFDELKMQRVQMMRTAVEDQLKKLVNIAAGYREGIVSAKTRAKKVYYEKKMKKVSQQVQQMLGALQKLNVPQVSTSEIIAAAAAENKTEVSIQNDS